jgi:DNA-binding protein YbaB
MHMCHARIYGFMDLGKKEGFNFSNNELYQLIKSVVYNGTYGTPEVDVDDNIFEKALKIISFENNDNRIRNVFDAYIKLSELLQSEIQKEFSNENFENKIKQGDLYVYCDGSRKMRYEPYIDPAVREAKAAEKEAIKVQRKKATASAASAVSDTDTTIP